MTHIEVCYCNPLSMYKSIFIVYLKHTHANTGQVLFAIYQRFLFVEEDLFVVYWYRSIPIYYLFRDKTLSLHTTTVK